MSLCTIVYPSPLKKKIRINSVSDECDLNIDIPIEDADMLIEMIKIAKDQILKNNKNIIKGVE